MRDSPRSDSFDEFHSLGVGDLSLKIYVLLIKSPTSRRKQTGTMWQAKTTRTHRVFQSMLYSKLWLKGPWRKPTAPAMRLELCGVCMHEWHFPSVPQRHATAHGLHSLGHQPQLSPTPEPQTKGMRGCNVIAQPRNAAPQLPPGRTTAHACRPALLDFCLHLVSLLKLSWDLG